MRNEKLNTSSLNIPFLKICEDKNWSLHILCQQKALHHLQTVEKGWHERPRQHDPCQDVENTNGVGVED